MILNRDEYAPDVKAEEEDDEEVEDTVDNIENTDNINSIEVIQNTENSPEPTGDIPDSSQETTEIPEPEIPVVTETTEPETTEAEAPTEPETTPAVPDTTEPEDTDNSPYYDTGAATVINIRDIFPDAPEKFREIQYPESVPMLDSLKKNIKSLANFSPRDFAGMSFYIGTTDATLFTPFYGSGMLSDARKYRTDIVDAECNTLITSREKPKESIIQDIKLSLQADEFFADILCVPFEIQSELVKAGLLMNLKKTPFLNINADYYNASATEAFTINGNIYGLVSDLTFDPSSIYAVFYNTDLVREYNLTNPIETYKNGKWDYESMFAVSKEFTAAAADLNNAAGPMYSIGFDKENNDMINGMFISSGSKYFSRREYTAPVLNFAGDKTLGLIEMLSKIFSLREETGMSNFLSSGEEVQKNAFMDGNILFSINKLEMIPDITDSAFDWGLLPVPALGGEYALSAGRQFSFTDSGALCISILNSGTRNTEACGIIIGALSSSSHKQLKEIYIREQMTYHLRHVESVKVLDSIINNLTFNQYNAFSTVPEIYNATVGVLKEAANQRGDFGELYDAGRNNWVEFFKYDNFFRRS